MPIKFRCPQCRQFLGISRSKAGEISDCPMCGKAVRVPDLDGTVKPLPTPELNLEDSSLVDALGELAGIGAETESGVPARLGAEDVRIAVELSSPAPEPIAREPLVAAKPIRAAPEPAAARPPQSSLDTAASVSEEEGTIDDPNAELRTIAGSRAAGRRPSKKRAADNRASGKRSLAEQAVVAVVFLAAGYGLAELFAPSGASQVDSTGVDPSGPDAAAADRQAAAGGVEAVPAVRGRVTYVAESGDTRPDEGSRIIALPEDRRGTVKMDVVGFLVGSAEADAEIAAASLRALGGDVKTADGQGEYALELSRPGSYQLLVISRHQSRSWEIGVEEDVQELLARFFIRPSTLLGQLAYDLRDFQYRGQGTSPRDVAFDRE